MRLVRWGAGALVVWTGWVALLDVVAQHGRWWKLAYLAASGLVALVWLTYSGTLASMLVEPDDDAVLLLSQRRARSSGRCPLCRRRGLFALGAKHGPLCPLSSWERAQ